MTDRRTNTKPVDPEEHAAAFTAGDIAYDAAIEQELADRENDDATRSRARAPELLSSEQMARRAGVTMRRLDLWVTNGYLQPAIAPGGTGRPRRWLEWQIGEVIEVREQHRPYDQRARRR